MIDKVSTAQQFKKMIENQISFLFNSSSLLERLAFILRSNPSYLPETAGSTETRQTWQDEHSSLKRALDSSMILLTEVNLPIFNYQDCFSLIFCWKISRNYSFRDNRFSYSIFSASKILDIPSSIHPGPSF
jgi:hypothetical protein